MFRMLCPLSPSKGAALTTLSPSKPQSAMANSWDCSASHSRVQPSKPQEMQLEQLCGTKMMLLLSLHLLRLLQPTFGSHFLHFSLTPYPPRIQYIPQKVKHKLLELFS